MNRREALTVLLGAAALSTGKAYGQDKGAVYFLIPDSGGVFYVQSAKVGAPLFEQAGYKMNVLDAGNKADIQLNQIDNVINLSPKAIVIAAVDFDVLAPGIEKARAAGIKVVAHDRPITNTAVDFTSMAGVEQIGATVAKELVALLKARKGGLVGKVLQIMGDPGDSYAVTMTRGFDGVMAGYPDIQVVTKAAQGWEPTAAANIAQDYLTLEPKVDAIFYQSGYLATAVVAALQALGKKPGELIILDGDGDPGGLAQLRSGWQNVCVEAPVYAEIYAVAAFVNKVVNGEEILAGDYDIMGIKSHLSLEASGPTIRIPGRVITSANVDDPNFWGNMVLPALKLKPADELRVGAN